MDREVVRKPKKSGGGDLMLGLGGRLKWMRSRTIS